MLLLYSLLLTVLLMDGYGSFHFWLSLLGIGVGRNFPANPLK